MTVPTTPVDLSVDEVRVLVSAAGAAPSLHNSQPWRFRVLPGAVGLEVRTDPDRAVPLTDPDGRAMHVSVGAALFNLRTAAAHLGRAVVVRLLPDPADPHCAARVEFGPPGGVVADPDLYAAVGERHSSRQPFTGRDVPESALGEFIRAAEIEHVRLNVLEEGDALWVIGLTSEAERRTSADIALQAETRGWLRLEEPADDGIPDYALGPLDSEARVPMRGFAVHGSSTPGPARRFEALPQLLLFTTRGDEPADWLRAGQAVERVWLVATTHRLRASVLHQAVEWPDTRWALRDPDQGPGHVQLVMRVGYGPPGPATPRRAWTEIVDTH